MPVLKVGSRIVKESVKESVETLRLSCAFYCSIETLVGVPRDQDTYSNKSHFHTRVPNPSTVASDLKASSIV